MSQTVKDKDHLHYNPTEIASSFLLFRLTSSVILSLEGREEVKTDTDQ